MHLLMKCYQNATHICDPDSVCTRFLAVPYTTIMFRFKLNCIQVYVPLNHIYIYIYKLYDVSLIKQMFYIIISALDI